jgi:predicted methyltransferase
MGEGAGILIVSQTVPGTTLARARMLLLSAIALVIGACSGLDPVASDDLARGASTAGTVRTRDASRPGSSAAIEQAVARAETRSDGRMSLAEQRQAPAVLEFFGIRPGMAVLDMYSGGGVYTRLLAYLVGDDGRVVVHDNTPYLDFTRGPDADSRGDFPANVALLASSGRSLMIDADSFDAALLLYAFPDVYFVDDGGWRPIDGRYLLNQLYAGLRPGAVLGVIEAGGSRSQEASGERPRRSPAEVRALLESAGFRYEADSGLLAELQTDPTARPRAIMRFRKPR